MLDKIARSSKFLKRKSKLTPLVFLNIMFYGVENEFKSLSRIVRNAHTVQSLKIREQSLDERFSPSSVAFTKELIKETLSSQVFSDINSTEFQLFKRVRVKDSTTFEIHESLANVFEGFGKGGGPNSKAGVSIQFEYDVKTNKVLDIDLKSAIQNDSNDAISKKDDIQKGDLILRDLGYYSDGIIAHYIEREAFFISKLYHNVSVRMNKSDEKKIDFQKIYTQMINLGRTHSDLPVFIGKKRRPVRLISVLVSDEVYQKRMRERAKANKSLGYEISDEYKIRARFNFYICNIPEDECTWETICKLYRIRWQIELVFKVWKSILHIDQTHKMKGDRFITMLYVKLLWVLINWQIICDCRNLFYKNGNGLLSISKSFQTLKESSKTIIKSMMSQTENIQKIIEDLAHSLSQNHWTEKRKSRCHLEEIFDIIFCESVNYSYI